MAKQAKSKPDNSDTNATLAASPTSYMDKEDYYRFRSDLAKVEQQSADQHDKTLVALAGGALAVSITFLEKIAPNPSPDSYSLLALGWLFLVVCLCVILLSFLTSQWACQQQMDLWDREYRGEVAGVGCFTPEEDVFKSLVSSAVGGGAPTPATRWEAQAVEVQIPNRRGCDSLLVD